MSYFLPSFRIGNIVQQQVAMEQPVGRIRISDVLAHGVELPEGVKPTLVRLRPSNGEWVRSQTGPTTFICPPQMPTGTGTGSGGAAQPITGLIQSRYSKIKYGYQKGRFGLYSSNPDQ